MALLDLIDGLTKRGLLDRVQIVSCEGASVQLGPKPIELQPLTAEQEEQKVTMPDPEDTLFGASEGMP